VFEYREERWAAITLGGRNIEHASDFVLIKSLR